MQRPVCPESCPYVGPCASRSYRSAGPPPVSHFLAHDLFAASAALHDAHAGLQRRQQRCEVPLDLFLDARLELSRALPRDTEGASDVDQRVLGLGIGQQSMLEDEALARIRLG